MKNNWPDAYGNFFEVGQLVVVNCSPLSDSSAWYIGKPGLLIGFDRWGILNTNNEGDPLVKYGNKTVRLSRKYLEVLCEAG